MKLRARKVNNFDVYAGHSWYTPGVGGLFALFGWFLVGSLLGGIVTAALGLFMTPKSVADYGMLVAYPLSFIPAMIWVAGKSRANSLFETGYKLNSSNFGPFKAWQIVLITIALAFAVMISADYPNYLNYKITTASPVMKELYDSLVEMLGNMTGGPLWSSFLLTAIFAPVFEEWLCRGMVLRGLLTKMKPGWAIVVSALFFAILHMNPWQALNAFVIGVVMGYVYYKTGSLWLTMLLHFVNNGTAVVLAQIPSLEEVDYWKDIIPGNLYATICVAGVIVLAVCIWAFSRIPLQNKHGNIDVIPAE